MYCYFRNIFPPWSSQMTKILITNAMYHIRYTNGEYEFKRINPYGLITAKHRLHQPTWKTPLYTGGNLVAFLNVERHSPWCVSKNTWAVANTTVDIHIIQSTCLYMNINCKPSTSSIPRKSTLLKSSDVCILCRTNTRRACMVSDGSGFHARRVLKHCPVLAPVLVADLRSDRSRIQCPFRQTFGKAHTTSRTLVCPACGVPPRLSRICSQYIFQ